jgi:putative endonuclease
MGDPRHDLGIAAERAVGAWLEGSGWRLLATRARSSGGGEIDIVALDPDGILVGIEVRARRTARTGTGTEAIHADRIARSGRTLAAFAAARTIGHRGLRLDIVLVMPEPGSPGQWRLRRVPDIGS